MIGRKAEKKTLLGAKQSEYSEFVAVYGRRRVGKTFLVRETFDYTFTFQHSGVANGTLEEQLHQFHAAICEQGYGDCPPIRNWFDAFDALKVVINRSADVKKLVFLDELPFMDVVGSRLIPALEHFWNGWAPRFMSFGKDWRLNACACGMLIRLNVLCKSEAS